MFTWWVHWVQPMPPEVEGNQRTVKDTSPCQKANMNEDQDIQTVIRRKLKKKKIPAPKNPLIWYYIYPSSLMQTSIFVFIFIFCMKTLELRGRWPSTSSLNLNSAVHIKLEPTWTICWGDFSLLFLYAIFRNYSCECFYYETSFWSRDFPQKSAVILSRVAGHGPQWPDVVSATGNYLVRAPLIYRPNG